METRSGCQRRHCTPGTLQVCAGRASAQASTAHVVSLPRLDLALREDFPEADPVIRAVEEDIDGCDTLFPCRLLLKEGFPSKGMRRWLGVTLVEGAWESRTGTADVGW